jgi:hypothetical protein
MNINEQSIRILREHTCLYPRGNIGKYKEFNNKIYIY